MAYEKRISRQHPGIVGALIDDSGSLSECLPGTSDPKFMWIECHFGNILKELLCRSTEPRGDQVVIKSRYHVNVIPYGSSPGTWQGFVNIEQAVEHYAASGNSLGLGGKLGGTDTEAGFKAAYEFLEGVVQRDPFKESSPPILFHLTDGESQTDATSWARKIMGLSTSDGNVLVANAYIGTQTRLNYKGPEDFPGYLTAAEAGPTAENIRLFEMSSPVPETIRANLIGDGIFPNLRAGARLFFDVRSKEQLKHVIQVVGSSGSRAAGQER